jgi:hypothetical protein
MWIVLLQLLVLEQPEPQDHLCQIGPNMSMFAHIETVVSPLVGKINC